MQGHAKHSGDRSTATVRRSGSGLLGRDPHRPRRARDGLRWQLAERGRGEHRVARVENVHDELDSGRLDGRWRILAGQPGRCVLGVRARTRRAQLPRPKNHHPRQRGERGDRDQSVDLGQSSFQVGAAGLQEAAAGRWSRRGRQPPDHPLRTGAVPEGGGVHPLPRRAELPRPDVLRRRRAHRTPGAERELAGVQGGGTGLRIVDPRGSARRLELLAPTSAIIPPVLSFFSGWPVSIG